MSPEKIAKAFYGETFKVGSPTVTIDNFNIELLVEFTQSNIKRLREQAELKDSPVLEMIARFFETDLNHFKASVKKAVLKGGENV